MQLAKLLTYTFPKNVGTVDRVLRVIVGAAIATMPTVIALATGWRMATILGGAMIAITGLVSRCGVYYMLGYTTCPLRDE